MAGPCVRAGRARAELADHVSPPCVPRSVEPDRDPQRTERVRQQPEHQPRYGQADRRGERAGEGAPTTGDRPADREIVPLRPGVAAPVLTGPGRPGASGPRRRVGRLGYGADDDDPPGAGLDHLAGAFAGSMPPIANQGRASPLGGGLGPAPRPVAGRPGLVGVACTGPAQR